MSLTRYWNSSGSGKPLGRNHPGAMILAFGVHVYVLQLISSTLSFKDIGEVSISKSTKRISSENRYLRTGIDR